jgi:hypothetical protein
MTTELKTIGVDNGIGDIFRADIEYFDGRVDQIIVYGGNLQVTSQLLGVYSRIYKFTVTNLF